METLRNKGKLAAVTRKTLEEHPWNCQKRNKSVSRINEEYITQVSEEIEGRFTKKLSLEFSRTESRILGVLSKLDEFFLNPQIRTHSGTVPGTFWNTNVKNQERNEDRSQDDSQPEVGPSVYKYRNSKDSDPDEAPHMVTGVQEEIPCYSPGTSSGKQKKAHCTSQSQFCSEITPQTIEADQIL